MLAAVDALDVTDRAGHHMGRADDPLRQPDGTWPSTTPGFAATSAGTRWSGLPLPTVPTLPRTTLPSFAAADGADDLDDGADVVEIGVARARPRCCATATSRR